ncbi:MAG: hypothetical protein C4293_13030 [Nitrospiraceae bacterium]
MGWSLLQAEGTTPIPMLAQSAVGFATGSIVVPLHAQNGRPSAAPSSGGMQQRPRESQRSQAMSKLLVLLHWASTE